MSGFKYASQDRKVLNLQCAINLNYLLFIYLFILLLQFVGRELRV